MELKPEGAVTQLSMTHCAAAAEGAATQLHTYAAAAATLPHSYARLDAHSPTSYDGAIAICSQSRQSHVQVGWGGCTCRGQGAQESEGR